MINGFEARCGMRKQTTYDDCCCCVCAPRSTAVMRRVSVDAPGRVHPSVLGGMTTLAGFSTDNML